VLTKKEKKKNLNNLGDVIVSVITHSKLFASKYHSRLRREPQFVAQSRGEWYMYVHGTDV
jgi:hypothetical protein